MFFFEPNFLTKNGIITLLVGFMGALIFQYFYGSTKQQFNCSVKTVCRMGLYCLILILAVEGCIKLFQSDFYKKDPVSHEIVQVNTDKAVVCNDQLAQESPVCKITLKPVKNTQQHIYVVKILREFTTLGLADALNAVVEAPTVLAESFSKKDAAKIKEALEALGVEVEIV